MSIRVLSDVWEQSRADGNVLLLELALADYADESGIAWPSLTTLARRCRVSRRHVMRLIEQAEEIGELARSRGTSWPRQRTTYRLLTPRDDATPSPLGTGVSLLRDVRVTTLGTETSPPRDRAVTQEPSRETSGDPSGEGALKELCPECRGAMVVKNGKRGEFLSCRRYPDCNGKRELAPAPASWTPTAEDLADIDRQHAESVRLTLKRAG